MIFFHACSFFSPTSNTPLLCGIGHPTEYSFTICHRSTARVYFSLISDLQGKVHFFSHLISWHEIMNPIQAGWPPDIELTSHLHVERLGSVGCLIWKPSLINSSDFEWLVGSSWLQPCLATFYGVPKFDVRSVVYPHRRVWFDLLELQELKNWK